MKEYHKIQSIYKRDEKGKMIFGDFSLPEFEYLKNNFWIWTEKVDGTNIRVIWDADKKEIRFAGKTDKSDIPKHLGEKLCQLFPEEKFKDFPSSLCLYGEGYGAKIQKDGGNYSPNAEFVLFDIKIDNWWLSRENILDIAMKLDIEVVPIVGIGELLNGIALVEQGYKSNWGDFIAEGLVMRPMVEMFNRNGNRIITKIKHKDFKNKGEKE